MTRQWEKCISISGGMLLACRPLEARATTRDPIKILHSPPFPPELDQKLQRTSLEVILHVLPNILLYITIFFKLYFAAMNGINSLIHILVFITFKVRLN